MNLRRAVLAAALFLFGPFAQAQINFQTYVAVGDSLTAGYSSGSLVESHQANSYPLLLARQGGVASSFQQPLIGQPGIPAELALVSLSGPVIVPKSDRVGSPLNLGLARPYNNMAVPGATTIDAATDKGSTSALAQIILRGLGTQVEQAVALRPSFITLWIGNNDVLGAAVRGRAIDGVTLTPTATFRQVYGNIVAGLRASGARIVAANLADVTTIPFVTTIPPYVIDPISREPVLDANRNRIPLIGPTGPLSSSSYVTLAAASLLAQGVGVPTAVGGRGTPLPDEVILDPAEVATIQDHVNLDNQAIRDICGAASIPVVDVNSSFRQIHEGGYKAGGVTITTDFLSGGLFSYDGVHPTNLGYAIVANQWIEAINAAGGSLPLLDLTPFFGLATTQRAPQAGAPVFSQEAWERLLAAFPTVDGR